VLLPLLQSLVWKYRLKLGKEMGELGEKHVVTSDHKITRLLPDASAIAPVCASQMLGKEMGELEAAQAAPPNPCLQGCADNNVITLLRDASAAAPVCCVRSAEAGQGDGGARSTWRLVTTISLHCCLMLLPLPWFALCRSWARRWSS
jgi:hypothetical protein